MKHNETGQLRPAACISYSNSRPRASKQLQAARIAQPFAQPFATCSMADGYPAEALVRC